MRRHVEIPHGCFVVDVKNHAAWTAIKFGFYMRGIPLFERAFKQGMQRTHKTVSEADFLLIGSTDPDNEVRMDALYAKLGLSP